MDESCYISESILLSCFTRELPADRQEETGEWTTTSEGNTKTARDIFQLYWAADTLSYMKHADLVGAFHQMKDRIHRHQRRISWMVWGQRVAACLALPLLAATLYLTLKNSPAKYVEIQTSPSTVAEANLSDGTKARLSLEFSPKRPTGFTRDIRNVELGGEAYFEVHRDKDRRFTVSMPFRIQTEVLDTEFSIEAYRTDNVVRTTLVSGSVKLLFLGESGEQRTFMMRPDEEFIYDPKTRTVRTDKPYVKTYTARRDGQVVFRNTPLSEALKILTKRFHMESTVKDSTFYGSSFIGVPSEQHLPPILEHLRLTPGIRYRSIGLEHDTQQAIQQKMKMELY